MPMTITSLREMKHLLIQGYTIRQIAARLEVSHYCIYYWMKKEGVKSTHSDKRTCGRQSRYISLRCLTCGAHFTKRWRRWRKFKLGHRKQCYSCLPITGNKFKAGHAHPKTSTAQHPNQSGS